MTELATYEKVGTVATITMDDGKANVISPAMLATLNGHLDRAEADDVVVVLAGRPDRFSAGFDLSILKSGGPDAEAMLRGGFELARRLLVFPRPVVIACTGHALAMGSFLLLSVDLRIGALGAYKVGANEVAIGLPMPRPALALLQYRLATNMLPRSVTLAEIFDPPTAVTAGFLDRVVEPAQVIATAQEAAATLSLLDSNAYRITKKLVQQQVRVAVDAGIESDFPAR